MPVSITVAITKTVAGHNKYDVSFVVSAAANIDGNVFVFDFPALGFQQVADVYAMTQFPVYTLQTPPPVRTRYVRKNTLTLSFPSPARAVEAIAVVKADIDALCGNWKAYSDVFVGSEEYVASV